MTSPSVPPPVLVPGVPNERATIFFDHVLGVPLHYSRPPVAPYGTVGSLRRAGPVKLALVRALEGVVRELSYLCRWGKPEVLVTGGVTGDGHGRHGMGEAVDLDSVWWPARLPLVTLTSYERQPCLYAGVDCVLRIYFGTVLNAGYNADHCDHWHCDLGTPVSWTPTRSHIVSLQYVLKYVYDQGLDVDGTWGPNTDRCANDVLKVLVPGDWRTSYKYVLRSMAKAAFDRVPD